jgi:hypothetical protein
MTSETSSCAPPPPVDGAYQDDVDPIAGNTKPATPRTSSTRTVTARLPWSSSDDSALARPRDLSLEQLR